MTCIASEENQRGAQRAENAADALQLTLCEHGTEIPMLAQLDNLASYVEPLCART